MEHLKTSKALALAIGWPRADIVLGKVLVCTGRKHDRVKVGASWMNGYRIFDYRDWAVAGPIAKKFDCFPYLNHSRHWVTHWGYEAGDTPQQAIAIVVITSRGAT